MFATDPSLSPPQVRLSRQRVLDSALRIMEEFAKKRTILEFEYFNEAGTGLGPTLEFYTILSQHLQFKNLHLWRCESPEAAAYDTLGLSAKRSEEHRGRRGRHRGSGFIPGAAAKRSRQEQQHHQQPLHQPDGHQGRAVPANEQQMAA